MDRASFAPPSCMADHSSESSFRMRASHALASAHVRTGWDGACGIKAPSASRARRRPSRACRCATGSARHCRADFLQQGRGLGVEVNERLLARAVVNRDRGPVEVLTDAGGEALRDRLLGRPARGIVLVRVFEAVAVSLLLLGEDALEETLAMLGQHAADALDVD